MAEPRIETIAQLAGFAAERFAEHPALRYKRDGEWQERSFAEVGETVRQLAAGLVGLGIEPGDRVCILANTRPEWTYLAFAIWSAGAVVRPDLPHELARGVRMGGGQLGGGGGGGEDAGQLAKIAAASGCPRCGPCW